MYYASQEVSLEIHKYSFVDEHCRQEEFMHPTHCLWLAAERASHSLLPVSHVFPGGWSSKRLSTLITAVIPLRNIRSAYAPKPAVYASGMYHNHESTAQWPEYFRLGVQCWQCSTPPQLYDIGHPSHHEIFVLQCGYMDDFG